jgi:hypothetical protein
MSRRPAAERKFKSRRVSNEPDVITAWVSGSKREPREPPISLPQTKRFRWPAYTTAAYRMRGLRCLLIYNPSNPAGTNVYAEVEFDADCYRSNAFISGAHYWVSGFTDYIEKGGRLLWEGPVKFMPCSRCQTAYTRKQWQLPGSTFVATNILYFYVDGQWRFC